MARTSKPTSTSHGLSKRLLFVNPAGRWMLSTTRARRQQLSPSILHHQRRRWDTSAGHSKLAGEYLLGAVVGWG